MSPRPILFPPTNPPPVNAALPPLPPADWNVPDDARTPVWFEASVRKYAADCVAYLSELDRKQLALPGNPGIDK